MQGWKVSRLSKDLFPREDLSAVRIAIQDACDAGVVEACRFSAEIWTLQDGRKRPRFSGVVQDYNLGLEYKMKGCALGDYYACLDAGRNYCNGMYVTSRGASDDQRQDCLQRQAKVRTFFADRCDENDGLACYNLAGLHVNFGGNFWDSFRLEPKIEKAKVLLEKGCKLGDWDSCFIAAKLYAEGKEFAQDQALAKDYYERGCDTGDPKACHRMFQLSSREGEDELAETYKIRACALKQSPLTRVRMREPALDVICDT
ncbi:tetratricopeptide repeat protein [Henriciella sp. AS95]|uniref:tetratricopeptide repeat protein n=1 Tax=Henriciella sp. AS95 TaxID=3135782 RepID=UPI00318065A1